jgi:hypothetical protein
MSMSHNATTQNAGVFYVINSNTYAWEDSAPDDLQWHHYVVTINGSRDFELWRDGVSVQTYSATSAVTGSSTTFSWFARVLTPNGDDGIFDDMRAFKRVITEDEIKHLAKGRGIQGNGKTRLKARYNEPGGVFIVPSNEIPRTRTLLGVGS